MSADPHARIRELQNKLLAEAEVSRDLLAAMYEIQTICLESRSDFRKRMGTRVGNILVAAGDAIAKAEARVQ